MKTKDNYQVTEGMWLTEEDSDVTAYVVEVMADNGVWCHEQKWNDETLEYDPTPDMTFLYDYELEEGFVYVM